MQQARREGFPLPGLFIILYYASRFTSHDPRFMDLLLVVVDFFKLGIDNIFLVFAIAFCGFSFTTR
jgi:hypothetical protein